MRAPQIVLDTNVLVAGLRSNRGASFALLGLVGTGRFEINLSVPLVMEYESVLARESPKLSVTAEVVEAVIDFHCAVATRHRIYFLWRPFLPDPKDDMVLEVAVKARASVLVTHNTRDFRGVEQAFGVNVLTPGAFLRQILGNPILGNP